MTYVAGTGKPGAGVDLFLARYAALRERLPGDRAARDAAADAFSVAGLPGPRLEAWKYTNLRGLAEIADATGTSPAEPSDLPDGARLVFVDGAFRADLSAASQTFAQAPLFPAAHGEPIALLNTMLASDGAVLDIAGDAGTLNLLSIGNASAHLRHRIRMAPGARLVLIERSRFRRAPYACPADPGRGRGVPSGHGLCRGRGRRHLRRLRADGRRKARAHRDPYPPARSARHGAPERRPVAVRHARR
jgi:hypothetical protein